MQSTTMLSSRGENPTMENYFSLRSTPRDQFSIKSVLASKEAIWRAYMTIARFFYDACILTNFVNSFCFKSMMDVIPVIGLGYKHPTYH